MATDGGTESNLFVFVLLALFLIIIGLMSVGCVIGPEGSAACLWKEDWDTKFTTIGLYIVLPIFIMVIMSILAVFKWPYGAQKIIPYVYVIFGFIMGNSAYLTVNSWAKTEGGPSFFEVLGYLTTVLSSILIIWLFTSTEIMKGGCLNQLPIKVIIGVVAASLMGSSAYHNIKAWDETDGSTIKISGAIGYLGAIIGLGLYFVTKP